MLLLTLAGCVLLSQQTLAADGLDTAWKLHIIDNSSRGADGVRLLDVNGDGLKDVTTGWEEGGVVRAYLNPGPKKVKQNWPAVTVGKVKSAEDAVFADLDGDGAVDVVSACEGRTMSLFVHWAPADTARYLQAADWQTKPIPASNGMTRWMFVLPMQVDGKGGVDLVVASKNPKGTVGWFESPKDARELSAWKFHKLQDAGWIMSLVAADMDGDADNDLIVSDRKGSKRGVYWLEKPRDATATWNRHDIGGADREVMFIDVVDLDTDGKLDVLAPVKKNEILFLQNAGAGSTQWKSHAIKLPGNIGTSKAVRAGDINLDGNLDLVFSCEQAASPRSGMMWLSLKDSVTDKQWTAHPMSGPRGIKYDRIELIDLDGDGDLDAMCCEERELNAIFWYENPTR